MVYDPRSGNTHFLDVFTGKVFGDILEGTAATEGLYSSAAAFLEVELDDRLSAAVDEALNGLQDKSLIEQSA